MAIEQKVEIPRWMPKEDLPEDAGSHLQLGKIDFGPATRTGPWPPVMSAIPDAINPPHYKSHPSGLECIEVTQHFNFCIGNAIKYLWRNGLKKDEGSSAVKDLKKAIWYIEREIANIEKGVYK